MGKISIEEKINSKRAKIKSLDEKISALTKRRNKLSMELSILESTEKAKKYENLEISLKESGLSLNELMLKIKKGNLEDIDK